MREAGLIRFATAGAFNPQITHDSFRRFAICFCEWWGLVDRHGEVGLIRFAEMAIFSGIQ